MNPFSFSTFSRCLASWSLKVIFFAMMVNGIGSRTAQGVKMERNRRERNGIRPNLGVISYTCITYPFPWVKKSYAPSCIHLPTSASIADATCNVPSPSAWLTLSSEGGEASVAIYGAFSLQVCATKWYFHQRKIAKDGDDRS